MEFGRIAKTALVLTSLAGAAGCSVQDRYAATGAGIGGLGGAAIGAGLTGNAAGAVFGGAVGAGAGALIGAAVAPGECYYRDEYGRRIVAACPPGY